MEGSIKVMTQYFEHSSASGALYVLVHVTSSEEGEVDFSRSALAALDRSASYNSTLPFKIFPGQNRVLVYSVEQGGTLFSGISFPAVTHLLQTREDDEGTRYIPMII